MTGSHWRCPAVSLFHWHGAMPEKREQLRVRGLLLLACRLLRWPTIVTSRLPSSPAACFCPSGSRPFPLDFLLWGPFGHAATQVKFKPPRSKSASQNSSLPPPSPPPSPRFSAKNTSEKRIVLTKNARAKKQGFRSKKSTQKIKSMSLMTGQVYPDRGKLSSQDQGPWQKAKHNPQLS